MTVMFIDFHFVWVINLWHSAAESYWLATLQGWLQEMSSIKWKSSLSLMSRSLEMMWWMSPHRMKASRSQSSFFCCSLSQPAEAMTDSWTCSSTRSRPPLTSLKLCSAGEVVFSAGEVVFSAGEVVFFLSLMSFKEPLSILERLGRYFLRKHNAKTVLGNDYVITVAWNDNAITDAGNGNGRTC